MNIWAPAPEPPTKLGRHRQLAPGCGLHVSPIQLGAMSIGDKWHPYGMGTMDKEASFKLLDAFYNAGGNFIDTANVYQDETSEEFIGEWMEARGNRDQMVVATKYSLVYKRGASFEEIPQKTQYVGNSLKSMHISVHDSLRKLRTSYIDIFYVHFWDYTCTIEEVMNGLHNLVAQGKVLYLGVSDTPAWVVSKANNYARMAGKTPFVIYEGEWNITMRDMERDIIPMCIHEGMAIAPWNVLCAGKIRTDAEEERRLKSGEGGRTLLQFDGWLRNETERKVSKALEKVAEEIGAKSITSVAIAYLMQKFPYVFPIVGGRKVEHLYANLEALDISLSPEQMQFLNDTVPFNKGFPYLLFGDGSDYNIVHKAAGHYDKWPAQQAIRPQK
uniref:Aryl-alcohol dehydrogenase [NADP(+)] n=1 Tax=Phanerodontia chrysosporium TaxID=2822231 RepID=AAD_PHACH|nr:RecName: Full=Aryl-alcohol dehydrogenase [NADP(+)]; Short=AAD [Phanerodontia chrysosporium]AAA61931.1 aryl-alcohol dehydrogenase [Phanerodontia chrysosporium]